VEKSKFLTANCRAGRTSLLPSMNQDTNFFCKFVWKIVNVFEIYGIYISRLSQWLETRSATLKNYGSIPKVVTYFFFSINFKIIKAWKIILNCCFWIFFFDFIAL
jgi:hypothetical protein